MFAKLTVAPIAVALLAAGGFGLQRVRQTPSITRFNSAKTTPLQRHMMSTAAMKRSQMAS